MVVVVVVVMVMVIVVVVVVVMVIRMLQGVNELKRTPPTEVVKKEVWKKKDGLSST